MANCAAKLTFRCIPPKEEVETMAQAHENVAKFVDGKTPAKVIYVPGRLVNIVVKWSW